MKNVDFCQENAEKSGVIHIFHKIFEFSVYKLWKLIFVNNDHKLLHNSMKI